MTIRLSRTHSPSSEGHHLQIPTASSAPKGPGRDCHIFDDDNNDDHDHDHDHDDDDDDDDDDNYEPTLVPRGYPFVVEWCFFFIVVPARG
ncbi:hypothetical protein AJ80_09077 [Polytolypa hystricis UAMH7299]|uniref:Uncharacterized protein n=1 Tax=Polytolypa hystricis (strain UAMH7299) TaxID=1447883 RepID=A0A2B7WWY4_POLH7|nr:hypothetical protein AJ80_09077 [Polytolypa hystricis UAMH7299]